MIQSVMPSNPMYLKVGDKLQALPNDASVEVPQGTSFDLYLPENSASTGFRWYAQMDDKTAKYVQESDQLSVAPGLKPTAMRAIPMRDFTFKVAPSSSDYSPFKVDFALQRPWWETSQPAELRHLTINVVCAQPR